MAVEGHEERFLPPRVSQAVGSVRRPLPERAAMGRMRRERVNQHRTGTL
jgi:hypothetical protein